jgi:hypothetical protein
VAKLEKLSTMGTVGVYDRHTLVGAKAEYSFQPQINADEHIFKKTLIRA